MYLEKINDSLYATDIIRSKPQEMLELKNSAVIHLVCHHTKDESIIEGYAKAFLENDYRVIHMFGEYSELWTKILRSIYDEDVIIIDYHVHLNDFIMDIGTHFIEKSELKKYHKHDDSIDRFDYIIFDDYQFFYYIKEDLKEAELI